ncbi:MAG: hypothetical protein LBK56_09385, partial [Gracilibacteraceae bacterium]|nr:hypothetical protein [Gracilibacteraceae bacterium]
MIYNIGKTKFNSEDYKEKLKQLPLLEVLKEIVNLSGCTLKLDFDGQKNESLSFPGVPELENTRTTTFAYIWKFDLPMYC